MVLYGNSCNEIFYLMRASGTATIAVILPGFQTHKGNDKQIWEEGYTNHWVDITYLQIEGQQIGWKRQEVSSTKLRGARGLNASVKPKTPRQFVRLL